MLALVGAGFERCGLLENTDDLVVGKTGCLHGNFLGVDYEKTHFPLQLICAGITMQHAFEAASLNLDEVSVESAVHAT